MREEVVDKLEQVKRSQRLFDYRLISQSLSGLV